MNVFKRSCLLLILITLTVASNTAIQPAYATSSFHGILSTSTTWTKANSPYTLDGPTAIASGTTITIEPGVNVNLNGYYLQVNGTLNAKGTDSEKIYFTNGQVIFTVASSGGEFENTITDSLQNAVNLRITKNTFNTLDVGGVSIVTGNTIVNLIAQDSATITGNTITTSCYIRSSAKVDSNNINCRLIFKGSGEASNNKISDGINADVAGATITINNNEIRSTNSYPLIYVTGSKAYIRNNQLIGNGNPDGIKVGGSYHWGTQADVTIEGNQISNCRTAVGLSHCWAHVKENAFYSNKIGIAISISSSFNIPTPGTNTITVEQNSIAKNAIGIEFQSDQLSATITNNNIQDNTNYNFKLIDTSSDITVSNNYWGTTDTNQISQKIYDQQYDFNLGKVNYNPTLTSPPAQAPAIPSDTQTPTPTQAPTEAPTNPPNQTPNETAASTVTPSQSGNQNGLDLTSVEVAILVVLIVIAVLIAILILTLRRR